LTFHLRKFGDGGMLIAVKLGLELKALICPTPPSTSVDYMNDFRKLSTGYRHMVSMSILDALGMTFEAGGGVLNDDPGIGEDETE